MTTETMPHTPFTGARVLVGAGVAALLTGLVTAVVGLFVDGSAAAVGALVGTVVMVVVFAGGALLVNAVAGALPTAALLVAVLTYTLQLALLGLLFGALVSSPTLAEHLDRRWLGIAVIAATFAWLVAQIVLTMRQRIPVYDLTESEPVRAANAGER